MYYAWQIRTVHTMCDRKIRSEETNRGDLVVDVVIKWIFQKKEWRL
jgi:hypothetical protein